MRNNRAVVYHFFPADSLQESNLDFFLKVGYRTYLDFHIMLAGEPKAQLPRFPNVTYHRITNFQRDYGGYSHAVSQIPELIDYSAVIFLNSGVCGPFLGTRSERDWTEPFCRLLNDEIQLAGSAINVLHPESNLAQFFTQIHHEKIAKAGDYFPHVQTMFFVLSQKTLRFLKDLGFFSRTLSDNLNHLIVAFELLLSTLVLKSGYNISCILPEYQGLDYRTITSDPNPQSVEGDPTSPLAYFGKTIAPWDSIFIKTSRHLYSEGEILRFRAQEIAHIAEIEKN